MEAIGSNYEIILVNDGSKDNSWAVISSLLNKYPNITALNLMRNYGQHNALLAGIRLAKYLTTITLDDDLQNPCEEIPKLLEIINQGFDVVYGRPIYEEHNIFRTLASQLTKLVLQKAMGADTACSISSFRAFRTKLRDAFERYSNAFVSIDVLLTWGSNKFTAIAVEHHPRIAGQSNYNLRSLITHALNLVTGFTTLPLRIASIIGLSLTVLGLILLVYVLGRYLMLGYSVPGFPFLASMIALFSGAQLFTLGVMGEYLARMYVRNMDQPSYTVNEQVSSTSSSSPKPTSIPHSFSHNKTYLSIDCRP
jgi:undecaprenyl-phosphate 4-deoxy-4-formamido-L-arabinose transferase